MNPKEVGFVILIVLLAGLGLIFMGSKKHGDVSSYDCNNGTCIRLQSSDGEFTSYEACETACGDGYTYGCMPNNQCVRLDSGGKYALKNDCLAHCAPPDTHECTEIPENGRCTGSAACAAVDRDSCDSASSDTRGGCVPIPARSDDSIIRNFCRYEDHLKHVTPRNKVSCDTVSLYCKWSEDHIPKCVWKPAADCHVDGEFKNRYDDMESCDAEC